MMEPLLRAELQKKGRVDITFDRLQPLQDATGYFPDGGWTRVLAWCLENSGDAFDDVLEPLLDNIPRLDGIVIHLDGDAAEHLGQHTQVALPAPLTVLSRVNFLTDVIEEWLRLSAAQRSRLIVAAPVLHTEAWINAAHSQGSHESVDAKAAFRATRSTTSHPKRASHYEEAGGLAAENLQQIAGRCVSYRLFQQEIISSSI